ncbi:hypothetical protein C8R45DRAFT_1139081 [Mycena sanguinolenta]|nr:hypothetical protein C8R45DRAFT_1139081 [Mycena sanguinolenta]
MFAPFVFAAVLVAAANATHTITLRNNCPYGVERIVSNYPNLGAPYTGDFLRSFLPVSFFLPQPGSTALNITAGQSSAVVVPDGWNGKCYWSGRICTNRPGLSGCDNDCFGGAASGVPCSMTEWTFDYANLGGQTLYDISNIQGFSIGQEIIPGVSGDIVTCPVNDCPCSEAYRSDSNNCGGIDPDEATHVGASSDYTVV